MVEFGNFTVPVNNTLVCLASSFGLLAADTLLCVLIVYSAQNLISVYQWPHRPCNAPMWFYKVGKNSSVKADLAIYSHILDVSGQCMSVSFTLGFKLDFSSCVDWDGFCKFSHIWYCNKNAFYIVI